MAVYTLFSQAATGSSLASDATAYTMGVQFSVSQSGGTLTGIWFYSASGAGVLPQTIALYAVSGASLVHSESASWSGAAGSGWVRAAFSSPPSLTASASYKAAVLQNTGANWYSSTANYWSSGAGSGGVANGPLSAPNNAGGDGGQDTFNSGSTLTYPASSFNATNYWVDPEVTIAAAAPAAPPLMPPGRISPAAFQFLPLPLPQPGLIAPSGSVQGPSPVFPAAPLMPPGLLSPAAWQFPQYRRLPLTYGVITGSGGVVVPKPKLSGTPPAVIPQGSWWGLDSVLKQSRSEFEYYVSRPPMACPNCGEPLSYAPATKAGSGVERYCKYDGWQYPRDYIPPSRPSPW